MSPVLWIVIGAAVVAFVIVLMIIGVFNRLVQMRTGTKNAWSQIDVQLKRRYDLIPNLVETVKGYAKHEKDLLENVAKARGACLGALAGAAGGAGGMAALGQAEAQLTGGMRALMAVVENYPDLKANENFKALMEELTSTENKVSFARQFYNDSVAVYNVKIEQFPSNVIAGMFSFKACEFFQIESPEERKAVQVKF
jgi:LemA protein